MTYDSWKTRSDREDDGDPIFVECEACGTEGRIYTTRSGHANDPDTIDLGECDVCQGTGTMEIEGERLDLEDLDRD